MPVININSMKVCAIVAYHLSPLLFFNDFVVRLLFDYV